MLRMPVPVMNIVDVVAVRHGLVATAWTVDVIVTGVRGVFRRGHALSLNRQ